MSPSPPHHTALGHIPPYRHTYAQWLAPASGGTLDIEHWILWVGSVLLIINSIKPYTSKLSDIFAQLLQTVFMKVKLYHTFVYMQSQALTQTQALYQTQPSLQPLAFFSNQSSTCRISVVAVLFHCVYLFCAFTCI